MDKKDYKFYDEKLGIDGTIEELLDWCYRYDDDYSDEALDKIAEYAKNLEMDWRIPVLVKKARHRKEDTLPYEVMKLDKIHGGKIGYSSTEKYGEVEIFEDRGLVIFSITTTFGTAAGSCTVEEFMDGEDNYLESLMGSIMFYNYTEHES